MRRVYHDRDADSTLLQGKRVAVVGFGSQGRAQALNLRDGGVDVSVALRPRSPRRADARRERLPVVTPAAAVAAADLLMLLVPDEEQGELFRREIASRLRPGACLGFGHGMAVHFGLVKPPPGVDVILVAPKGPGDLLRANYLAGGGLPAFAAVGQDASGKAWKLALAYASAIGCARAGVMRTTFREETITDLFGEQAVLTGGVAELARAAFDTLVEAGYPPEVAYIECVQEIRGLADLLFERGIAGMRDAVSRAACWGGMRGGREVVDQSSRRRMRALLKDLESGRRVRWMLRLSAREKAKLRRRDHEHRVEKAGRSVRTRLRWQGLKELDRGGRAPLE